MNSKIEKLIQVAKAEIGYCEKSKKAYNDDPSVLDEKTKGAGVDNITKYGRDMVKWVGSPYTQGAAWCDSWCDWVFITAFGKDEAKRLLGGWSAYTPTSAQYYKDKKQWYTSNPQPGDQIFFKNETRICHTGIVYKVDNAKVYTIEGNTSGKAGVVANGGMVAEKSYNLNNTKIAGYGRPQYETTSAPPTTTKLKKGVDLSKYNKITNYLNLKAAGVKFGIIKIIEKSRNEEPSFKKHYNGLCNSGIPILCVYNYSYALNVEDAQKDARAVIKALDGRIIPVALDIEDKSQISLGEKLIDIIKAYQKVIEDAGLTFILYTGMSFYNSYLKPYQNKLGKQNIWIARYPSTKPMSINDDPNPEKKPQIDGVFMWQYSSTTQIPEACSGNLDCNILYSEPNPPIEIHINNNPIASGYVNTHSLRVRNTPNTSGKVVGYLMQGQKVLIYDTDPVTGWYKLSPRDDDPKWASNKFIEINK